MYAVLLSDYRDLKKQKNELKSNEFTLYYDVLFINVTVLFSQFCLYDTVFF